MTLKQKRNKRHFNQAMKWNMDCKKENRSKCFPRVTVGAFGKCKFLKLKECVGDSDDRSNN